MNEAAEPTAPGCSKGCCATPREHWLSVAISPAATPTRRENATRPKEG
jgi:hypothetical protein